MSVPAVIQYPTRTLPDVRGKKGNVTPGRWATIDVTTRQITDLDFIVRDEVINISLMIPPQRPPELPGLVGAELNLAYAYVLERVSDGVKIGMIRNGAGDSAGGFGFPLGGDVLVWNWFANDANSGHLTLFEDI